MSESNHGSDSRALATIVAGIRPELVDAAISSLEPPTRDMLISQLAVNDFFDHLLSALNVDTFKGMQAWLRGSAHGYLWTTNGRLALLGGIAAFKEMFWLRAVGYEHIAAELDAIETEVVDAFPDDAAAPDAELIDEVDVTIDALLRNLTADSRETADHVRAVGAWCERIALNMNMENEQRCYVRRAALLCDIGKLTTPRHILQAQRDLDARERRIVERHVSAGAQMVNDTPQLRPFVPVVLSHHERFDGRGYPHGVAGGSIPVPARIVAVADAFNAMIARRPHRRTMMPMRALEELHRHRSTQFDPDVVEAMTRVVLGTNAGEIAS